MTLTMTMTHSEKSNICQIILRLLCPVPVLTTPSNNFRHLMTFLACRSPHHIIRWWWQPSSKKTSTKRKIWSWIPLGWRFVGIIYPTLSVGKVIFFMQKLNWWEHARRWLRIAAAKIFRKVFASWREVCYKISRSRHAATRNPKRPHHCKNQPRI